MVGIDRTTAGLAPAPVERSAVATVATGLVGGAALGVAARGWMRLISDDPGFTWSGSVFIVGAFTVFGLVQAVVAVGRRRAPTGGRRSLLRTVGGAGLLPLFVGAGALMAPTVIGGGLALGQRQRRPATRVACAVVAGLPVAFVATDLVGSFGWSLRTAAGVVGLVALYATIVRVAQATFAAPVDRAPAPRWMRWAIGAGVALLLVASLGFGGIQ